MDLLAWVAVELAVFCGGALVGAFFNSVIFKSVVAIEDDYKGIVARLEALEKGAVTKVEAVKKAL